MFTADRRSDDHLRIPSHADLRRPFLSQITERPNNSRFSGPRESSNAPISAVNLARIKKITDFLYKKFRIRFIRFSMEKIEGKSPWSDKKAPNVDHRSSSALCSACDVSSFRSYSWYASRHILSKIRQSTSQKSASHPSVTSHPSLPCAEEMVETHAGTVISAVNQISPCCEERIRCLQNFCSSQRNESCLAWHGFLISPTDIRP